MGCCVAKARVAALEAEIEKVQAKLQRAEELAEIRVAASKKECSHQLAESVAEQAAEFDRLRKELDACNQGLHADIVELRDKHVFLNQEKSQLQNALDQMVERLERTDVELEQLCTQKECLEGDLLQMCANKDRMEYALEQMRAKYERAEEKLKENELDLEQMRAKSADAEKDLEQMRAEKACTEERKTQLEMQLNHNVCELEMSIREAGAQMQTLEAEKEQWRFAFEGQTSQIAALEASNKHLWAERQAAVAALEARNKHLWAESQAAAAREGRKWVAERLVVRSPDDLHREMLMKEVEL